MRFSTNSSEIHIAGFMVIISAIAVISSHFVFRNPLTFVSFTSLSFGMLILSCLSWIAAYKKYRNTSRWMVCFTMILGFTGVLLVDGYIYTGVPTAMTFIALVPAFFSGGKRALMSLILLICLYILFLVIGFIQHSTLTLNGQATITPIQLAIRYGVVFVTPLVHHIYEQRMMQAATS
jgi:hypothetical protein